MTSEGRLLPTANGFEREDFLSDHLGNTRVIFGKNAQGQVEIKQVVAKRRSRPIGKNHYYAYGMEIADQSFSSTPVPNTFLYNGKEYDQNTGYYQYGFRQYDAQIGLCQMADTRAEQYFSNLLTIFR
jgi:RHS repeat-associated protein